MVAQPERQRFQKTRGRGAGVDRAFEQPAAVPGRSRGKGSRETEASPENTAAVPTAPDVCDPRRLTVQRFEKRVFLMLQ